jgi:hypothetical protein
LLCTLLGTDPKPTRAVSRDAIKEGKPVTEHHIKRLTVDQLAWHDEVRDEWVEHCLATDPADRPAAVAGVQAAYRAVGLEPPRMVVWLDSPLAGVIGSRYLAGLLNGPDHDGWDDGPGTSVTRQVHEDIGHQFFGWVDFPAAGQIQTQVGRRVEAQVRPVLGLVSGAISDRSDDRIWRRIGDQVEAQVRAQAGMRDECKSWSQIWGTDHDRVGYWVYRQGLAMIDRLRDAALLADLDMCRRLGMECSGPLTAAMCVARSAGAWWPMRDAVVLTERPVELHRDSQGRLHCAAGPAIRYPDGWSVYAWHGTGVPASLLDGWTIEQIMSEPNSEVRRCAVEHTAAARGWRQLVEHARWPQVGRTVPDPGNPGQTLSLYRVEGIYDEPVNLLCMTNGTPERDGTRREFGETVPATITDPIAAAAWQIGISPAAYRKTVRRT